MTEKVQILTSKISIWNLDETVVQLRRLSESGERHYVCVSNVHTVVMGTQDPEYARVTNEATLATADGMPLVWASELVGGPRIHGRASGPDILEKILNDSASHQLRHFFYGSTPQVLGALKSSLPRLAPRAQISGYLSPPMRQTKGIDEPLSDDELDECRRIDETSPHIVWVGLGAPKQEIWMYRARKHLKAPVLIGVGAAFDFLSGGKPRAPLWMQKSGLEWLHRMGSEPRRLMSRYLKTNPAFVIAVAKQALFERNSRSSS